MFALFAIPIVLVAIVSRRTEAIDFLRARWRPGGLAALFNFGSYGLAIFALSLGAMAHVSALRETSVIIAALIGAVVLKEPFGRSRIAAAALVATGVATMHLAG